MAVQGIQQGTGGVVGDFWDSYFTTAVVAAAQFSPNTCDDIIDATFEAQGIYGVALYFDQNLTLVHVDSSMPCFKRAAASPAAQWRLLFGAPSDHREIWGSVVVKAYAKLCGSYEAMHARGFASLMQAIFGGDYKAVQLSSLRGGDKAKLVESVWTSIRCKGGLLVLAGSRSLSSPAGSADMKGIPMGRCFTVVSCLETRQIKLIQLVDPMVGKMQCEWTGAYSSSSSLWTPELTRAAENITIEDGFWMPFTDFITLFDLIGTCTVPSTAQQTRINTSLLAFSGLFLCAFICVCAHVHLCARATSHSSLLTE